MNLHRIDRLARFVLGAGLLSLVFLGPQTAWGYIGLIALATALSGFCPVYRIFGLRTRKPGASCCSRESEP